MPIDDLLKNLANRLPELEWQLGKLSIEFSSHLLPPGLFQLPYDAPKKEYIRQLHDDIARIAKHEDMNSIYYLVEKINRKINVLVNLCTIHSNGKTRNEVNLTLDKLSTRQEWLVTLEETIKTLSQQKQALLESLNQRLTENQEAKMNLHSEIGLLEKKLTQAKENYFQATGVHL